MTEPTQVVGTLMTVIAEVITERQRQLDQFTAAHDDGHTLGEWNKLIAEYISKGNEGLPRKRYIQIAAIATAAIESFDRAEITRAQPPFRHSVSIDPPTGYRYLHHSHGEDIPCDLATDVTHRHLFNEVI